MQLKKPAEKAVHRAPTSRAWIAKTSHWLLVAKLPERLGNMRPVDRQLAG